MRAAFVIPKRVMTGIATAMAMATTDTPPTVDPTIISGVFSDGERLSGSHSASRSPARAAMPRPSTRAKARDPAVRRAMEA